MSDDRLERILLIEDDHDIQVVARLALEDLGGFDVRVCDSGTEALDAVEAFAPDLILLDVMMPQMDGPATLSALRSTDATRDTPVVFMTAKAQPDEVAAYRRLGALDVIIKPFDPMTLCDAIRAIWQRHRA
ncbi:MAG: response regulator [Acidobacteriota bacterium]